MDSILQSGKKVEELGSEELRGTPEFIRDRLNQMVYLLVSGEYMEARKVQDILDNFSKEDFENTCRLSFDIADQLDETETLMRMAETMPLDRGRMTRAILPAVSKFVRDKNFDGANELIQKYKDSLNMDTLSDEGLKELEAALIVVSVDDNLEFLDAAQIQKVYGLEKYVVSQVIETKFDQLMEEEKYLSAASLVQSFDCHIDRVKSVAYKAYEVRFDALYQKLEEQILRGRNSILLGSAYKDIYQIVTGYQLLDTTQSPSKSKAMKANVKNKAFALVRLFAKQYNNKRIELIPQAVLCATMMKDFQLADLSDTRMAEESGAIIVKILSGIEDTMMNLKQVNALYASLRQFMDIYPGYKGRIKRLGLRAFEIYIKENQFKAAMDAVEQFEIDADIVYKEVRLKVLEMLGTEEPSEILKVVNFFHISDNLMKDDAFNKKVFEAFEKAMSRHSVRNAKLLCDSFQIPIKKRVAVVKHQLKNLLLKQKDHDANVLIDRFRLQNKNVKHILIEVYNHRLQQDVLLAVKFRQDFSLSILDVGILNWVINEFFGKLFRKKAPVHLPDREQSPSKIPAQSSAA